MTPSASRPTGGITMAAVKSTYDDLFEFIIRFKKAHDGVGPTIQEICNQFGWASKNTGAHALDRLVEQGRITLGEGARMIFVKDGEWKRKDLD